MPQHTKTKLANIIVEQAYYVHSVLGSGFREKVYENALLKKLNDIGISVKPHFNVEVFFENTIVGNHLVSLLVEDEVIVELKAEKKINPIDETELVNSLKATDIEVGVLINFGYDCQIKKKLNTI